MKRKYYIQDYSYNNLYKLGFRYSFFDDCYIYIFPVERYKRRPTVLCKIYVDINSGNIDYQIFCANGNINATYYNNEYGNADNYRARIDRKVRSRFRYLRIRRIYNRRQQCLKK